MNDQPEFDVFLAHNSKDKPFVRVIANELEQRGLKPWLDEKQIPPGRLFQDEIQQAIPVVKSAAIFIGSQGLGAWQTWELKALISQCVKKNIPVIPVLLPGVNDLPKHLVFLEQLSWITFSEGIDDENALDLLEWGITGQKPEKISKSNEKPGQIPNRDIVGGLDVATTEPYPVLPTFEIGTCTEGSPFEMQCNGEIIGGFDAATIIVEEIESNTEPSDSRRFDVRVEGIERISNYLATMNNLSRSEDAYLRRALRDWEKHLNIFQSGVEFVLWNSIFRNTAWIYNSESAAETICGLSKHCFELSYFPLTWWLWYEKEQKTRLTFHVTEDIRNFMESGFYEDDYQAINRRQGIFEYKAYEIGIFFPRVRHQYVFPKLLIYVAEQKVAGASQATINKYLDVSRWRWSINDPDRFVRWT